jgi:hypothetical protein
MTGGRLSFRGLLRERAIRASRVVELEVDWGRPSGRVSPLWLLIEESGRATLALNRKVWDERRLEELRSSLDCLSSAFRPRRCASSSRTL